MAKAPDSIKLNTEVTLIATTVFDDIKTYEKVVGKITLPPATISLTYERPMPYTGRRPKFVLWGARAGDVVIGSRDDKWWQRRLRGSKMKIHIPRVRFK